MNFFCSRTDLSETYIDCTRHRTKTGWFIYLDSGWSLAEDYFFKGFSSSWCKIYFDPIIKIETNKLRDFPIYYNKDSVTNFQKLDTPVPIDGTVSIDKEVSISYIENFYPKISNEHLTFEECHDILCDAIIENVGTFALSNKKQIYMPAQGGIDTLTVRSVFDVLEVPYETFDLPTSQPELSSLGSELSKINWGFKQIDEKKGSVIATGFYGDEWILRNPYYVHAILSLRDVNLIDAFDNLRSCYMKEYFENYRNKCESPSNISIETLITQICNDFQIWHLHDTYFLSPLKHLSLLTLLNADTQTIIDQVTDAKLSKSIIEKCNPKLLDMIDPLKNQTDPVWFP